MKSQNDIRQKKIRLELSPKFCPEIFGCEGIANEYNSHNAMRASALATY